MSRQAALICCLVAVVAMFARDRRLRPMTSWGLWIVFLWVGIIGSRPISQWFGHALAVPTPDDYTEGSPLDRAIFLALSAAGALVLLQRPVRWSRCLAENRWTVAFLVYCGISIVWSDFPFVSLKRWIKDVGNVVMVLILLTERDPRAAIKAVFSRYIYFAIPLSVVLIKYFPELGRYSISWTWQTAYSGVTTDKNGLGAIALVCAIFLLWDLTENTKGRDRPDLLDASIRLLLLAQVLWLVWTAGSSTTLVCLCLAAGMLICMHYPGGRQQVLHLGTYSLAGGSVLLIVFSFFGGSGAFAELLGRDATLTGRTDLWAALLNTSINPIVGTGYQSFWLGSRLRHFWEVFIFRPNQAHNGYLEVYLNGGVLGISLLSAMIISAGRRVKREVHGLGGLAALRLVLLLVALLYNWTEAAFSNLSLIWIIMLIAAIRYHRSSSTPAVRHHPVRPDTRSLLRYARSAGTA